MSKKRKSFAQLEREVEDKIVDWFQEQELLYRVDANGYSNKTKKDAVWAAGAKRLGIEEEHLRHFIRDKRTLLSKLIKPGKLGAGTTNLTERKQWVLRRFGFLRKHIQHRRTACSSRQRKETIVENGGDGQMKEEAEMEMAVPDCASDIDIQKEKLEKFDTIDPQKESPSESNVPTITKTLTSTQIQVQKRPVELLSTIQVSAPRSPKQPIPPKAQLAWENAAATKSMPHTDSPSPRPTHSTADIEEEEKQIIKQMGQLVKENGPKKGIMDEQVKSFLEMMGTSMMSLNMKRRNKAQRKLLNLLFDELEQQEKEDAQQSASPWCNPLATPVPLPHSTFGQKISNTQTISGTMPTMYTPSAMYSPSMLRSSVLTQSMPGPSVPRVIECPPQFGVVQLYYGQHSGSFTDPTPAESPEQTHHQPQPVQHSTSTGGTQGSLRLPPITTSTSDLSSQRNSLRGAVEPVIPNLRSITSPSGNTDPNVDA